MQKTPSNKAYTKPAKELRDFLRKYTTSQVNSVEDLSREINAALEEISNNSGGSVRYEPITFGFIPNSFEINKFIDALTHDMNVLFDEMEILSAGTLHNYNFIQNEILKSENLNKRLHNKIKTLQMYSQSEDKSIVTFGDYFLDDSQIDWSFTAPNNRVKVHDKDYVTLGALEEFSAVDEASTVIIQPGSNGLIGNNQQVDSSGLFVREFLGKTPVEELRSAIDGNPNTSFEFEMYQVSPQDRARANGYNFEYYAQSADPSYLYLSDQDSVDWASGPSDGVLTLKILVDFGGVKSINDISLTPFGLQDGSNPPITLQEISVSRDKGTWTKINKDPVVIANGIDQNTVLNESNVIYLNSFSQEFEDIQARYALLVITQDKPIDVKIGHSYYIKDNQVILGPQPYVDQVHLERLPNFVTEKGVSQGRNIFQGKRWAIGIRDLEFRLVRYRSYSEFVSKRIDIPGGVGRVSLEADLAFPQELGDQAGWVRFYVSPDDGVTWHPISRVQENNQSIPEVIVYNENTPVEYRPSGLGYYDLPYTPDQLRVKVEMYAPESSDSLSPMLKSYQLKVKRKLT